MVYFPRIQIFTHIDLSGHQRFITYLPMGKKCVFALPTALLMERVTAGKPIRVAITAKELFGVPQERHIEELRDAVITLLPPEWQAHTKAITQVKRDWEAYNDWLDGMIELVIQRAATTVSETWDGDRSPCPLCRATPADVSAVGSHAGYTVPIGLDRHVRGFGNVHRCTIMDVFDTWYRSMI